MIYSQLRFEQYAKDLERAVFDLSREQRMTERFSSSSIPRVMPWFKPESQKMSNATELPTVDIIKPEDVGPVSAVVGRAPTSNITGLQSGAFQDAMAQLRKRVADKQKAAIATIGNAVASGEAKIEAAAADVANKVDKEISGALQEFSQYSNGGPA